MEFILFLEALERIEDLLADLALPCMAGASIRWPRSCDMEQDSESVIPRPNPELMNLLSWWDGLESSPELSLLIDKQSEGVEGLGSSMRMLSMLIFPPTMLAIGGIEGAPELLRAILIDWDSALGTQLLARSLDSFSSTRKDW